MVSLKDYYRKPYMFDGYSDMMISNSNETVRDAIADIRKFEFLKPYKADSEDEVESDYSRIVNEYTLPSNKVLTLYMLENEGNFTLDYKRYHPPNKSHMCPEIPDPWGESLVQDIQGYTYKAPTASDESSITTDNYSKQTSKPSPQYTSGSDKGYLHWKVSIEGEVVLDKEYPLEVFNGFKRSYQTKDSKVIKDSTQYKQSFFSLTKIASGSKGVKLLQKINYNWYDVTSNEFNSIRESISKNQITNLMQSTSVAKLIINDSAQGKYRIKVSDGTTTLTKEIEITALTSGYYIKCFDTITNKVYYGLLSEVGEIISLHSFSSLFKGYNQVSLEDGLVYESSSSTHSHLTDNSIPFRHMYNWTALYPGYAYDEVWQWNKYIEDYTESICSWEFKLNGVSILTGGSADHYRNGSIASDGAWTRYGMKWVDPGPVLVKDFLYTEPGTDAMQSVGWGVYTITYDDGSPMPPEVLDSWTYGDLYYLEYQTWSVPDKSYLLPSFISYSSRLTGWDDLPMDVSQLCLREDEEELLFINPNTHNFGFLIEEDNIDIINIGLNQTVGDIVVQISGYDHANIYCIP